MNQTIDLTKPIIGYGHLTPDQCYQSCLEYKYFVHYEFAFYLLFAIMFFAVSYLIVALILNGNIKEKYKGIALGFFGVGFLFSLIGIIKLIAVR